LNSNKWKIASILVTSLLLAAFSGLNAYLPTHVEAGFSNTITIEKRVEIADSAIQRFKTVESVDSKVVIEILEADKRAEISADKHIKSTLELFGRSSNVLVWLLLMHFLALMTLVPIGRKN
jgi:hypothetical protein